jgi:hypothetical protein
MWFFEQLFRDLTEIIDETNCGVLFEGIVNRIDVDISLIKEMMKNIYGFDSRRTLTFKLYIILI